MNRVNLHSRRSFMRSIPILSLASLVLTGFGRSAVAQNALAPASRPPAWVSGFWDGTWVTPTFMNFTDNNELTLQFTQVTTRAIKARVVFTAGDSHPGGTYNVNVKVSGNSVQMSGGGLTLTGTHSVDQGLDGLDGRYTRPSESGEFVLTKETTAQTEIDGEIVIRDNPRSPVRKLLSSSDQFLAYGGSGEATADELTLRCQAEGSVRPKRYTWSAQGPGAENYPPPPPADASSRNANLWIIGDKFVPAKPADLSVTCTVDWSDGSQTDATHEVQIGVRTDDVIVIGWINPSGVPLDPTGIGADVLKIFPASGRFKSLADQVACATYLGALTLPGPLVRPNGTGVLTQAEAIYILNWQFKYAANKMPPAAFGSESSLDAFKGKPGGYKLFNRAQIKYRSSGGSMTVDGVLHQDTAIGTTLDPITGRIAVPGVSGPDDGKQQSDDNSWSLINEGSPDPKPVAAFNHLVAALNVTWNDIGSQINFSVDQGANAHIGAQLYPTYNVYVSDDQGGWKLQSSHPQAANPLDNFTNPSFPNGTSDTGLLFRRFFNSG